MTIFNFLRRRKIGKIQLTETTVSEVDVPTTAGRRVGVITPPKDGEVFFYSYEEKTFYTTFWEYGEWAGMVCEALVEQDSSWENTNRNTQGFAYQLFVRSLGDGNLYELPTPETIRAYPSSHDCRCPFCIIELAQSL